MPTATLKSEDASSPIEPELASTLSLGTTRGADVYPTSESPDWEYSRFFDSLSSEPVDLSWAPQTEATIESALRSAGRFVGDVSVRCGTTECAAVITYQPSFFYLDLEAQEAELRRSSQDFGMLESLVQVSPRLVSYDTGSFSLDPFKSPDDADPVRNIGTFVHFTSEAPETDQE